MSSFHDGYSQQQRASVTVHTDTPEAKVTYRGDHGQKFSVIVRQKPNPIGFGARLPGDKSNARPGTTGSGTRPPSPPKR